MAAPNVKISALGLVLIGKFAPSFFHPSWFAGKGLIPNEEAELAKIEVISEDIAIFNTEWMKIAVAPDRFSISTTKENAFPLLRDLVQGTFQTLNEIPVTALGINREIHFDMLSNENWHAVGDKLAPKGPWAGILEKPGMLAVRMQGIKGDDEAGNINVTVNPSNKSPHTVCVQINDHYDFKDAQNTEPVIKLITSNFLKSLARSQNIAQHLVSTS